MRGMKSSGVVRVMRNRWMASARWWTVAGGIVSNGLIWNELVSNSLFEIVIVGFGRDRDSEQFQSWIRLFSALKLQRWVHRWIVNCNVVKLTFPTLHFNVEMPKANAAKLKPNVGFFESQRWNTQTMKENRTQIIGKDQEMNKKKEEWIGIKKEIEQRTKNMFSNMFGKHNTKRNRK